MGGWLLEWSAANHGATHARADDPWGRSAPSARPAVRSHVVCRATRPSIRNRRVRVVHALRSRIQPRQPIPRRRGGGASTTLGLGGASLVLNAGNEHNLFYILGGYTRMRFADNPAYTFNDNGFHGAIGDRMFLGERVALRLEGRAIYSPSTGFSGGTWASRSPAPPPPPRPPAPP